MPDLLVGSVSVRVRKNSWRHLPSLYQGGDLRNADNSITSTLDATTEKERFRCEVYFLDATERAALKAAMPVGEDVTVSGDLPDRSFVARLWLGEGTGLKILNGGVQAIHRTFTLDIEEA